MTEILTLALGYLFFQMGRYAYWWWVDTEEKRRMENFVWPPYSESVAFIETLARHQAMLEQYGIERHKLALERAKFQADHDRFATQLATFESATTH